MRCVRSLICLAFFSCATVASASTEYGFVKWVSVRASDGLIWFTLSAGDPRIFPPPSRSTRPACATQGYWVIPNEGAPAGRMLYDALLRAKGDGVPVVITGTGTCTRWPDGEDADIVQVGGINF